MKVRTERLPVAKYINGKWNLSEPYDGENRIYCSVVGQMCDGSLVWEDENGKQYSRQRFFGKYYFCVM